jgi:hypothetical protein
MNDYELYQCILETTFTVPLHFLRCVGGGKNCPRRFKIIKHAYSRETRTCYVRQEGSREGGGQSICCRIALPTNFNFKRGREREGKRKDYVRRWGGHAAVTAATFEFSNICENT